LGDDPGYAAARTGDRDEQIDLTAHEPRPDYAAWRDRMRKKSDRNRDLFQPPEPERRGTYWDPELLFQGAGTVTSERAEHLAVLDLRDGATPDEIATAYRNLAKLHHPDRWTSADTETRRFHEDCMRAVNEAYHALRDDHRV
jgi:DnaJ-domain-containing protein 1